MDFVTIETNRLMLKGIAPEQMRHLFETFEKAEIKRILGHRSDEDFEKEAYKHKNGYSSYNRSFILFLLTHKASETIIGRCGIHNWNMDHKRAEIGYVMHDLDFRCKGLMTEALGAILEYGFKQLNLNRIEALVGAGNTPSLRLMEKFKFVREGILRQHMLANGQFEDSILFSKLIGEYGSGFNAGV